MKIPMPGGRRGVLLAACQRTRKASEDPAKVCSGPTADVTLPETQPARVRETVVTARRDGRFSVSVFAG
jgi:hypothetical protein